jgi:hypothetical protein
VPRIIGDKLGNTVSSYIADSRGKDEEYHLDSRGKVEEYLAVLRMGLVGATLGISRYILDSWG